MHSAGLSHRKPGNIMPWGRTCTAWLFWQCVWAPKWCVMRLWRDTAYIDARIRVTSLKPFAFSVVFFGFFWWTDGIADYKKGLCMWTCEVWSASVDDSLNNAENDAIVHLITIPYELVPVFHTVTLILLIAAILKLRGWNSLPDMSVMQKSVRRGHLFKEMLTGTRIIDYAWTQRTYIARVGWVVLPPRTAESKWRQSGRKKHNTHMRMWIYLCIYVG
jgi:hypothetical protein